MERSMRTLVAVLVCTGAIAGPAAAEDVAAPRRIAHQAAPPARILISFKLDPRLTRSLYMGDRWMSPARYQSTLRAAGERIAVEARAVVIDTRGRRTRLSPTWSAAAADLVAVSPGPGNEVTITARQAGESTVTVSYGPISRTLSVRSVRQGAAWRVEISQ